MAGDSRRGMPLMPNRIEREIEEILTRLDEFVPEEKRTRRWRRRFGAIAENVWSTVRGWTRGITGGHVVLGAAVLILLALLIRGSSPELARWMTYVGLAIIFGAIVLSIRPIRRGSASSRYWRGQPIELRRRTNPLTRLRMWWRRRNRPRY